MERFYLTNSLKYVIIIMSIESDIFMAKNIPRSRFRKLIVFY